MARSAAELRVAIEKEVKIMRESPSEQTRGYARERFHYLQGELMLQKAKEARGGAGKKYEVHVDGAIVFSEEYETLEDAKIAQRYWQSEEPSATVILR